MSDQFMLRDPRSVDHVTVYRTATSSLSDRACTGQHLNQLTITGLAGESQRCKSTSNKLTSQSSESTRAGPTEMFAEPTVNVDRFHLIVSKFIGYTSTRYLSHHYESTTTCRG